MQSGKRFTAWIGKTISWVVLVPIVAKTHPKQPTATQNLKTDTTINVGKQQLVLNNETTREITQSEDGREKPGSQLGKGKTYTQATNW